MKMIYEWDKKKEPSLGGLEPPTFRLTAERAYRLRNRDRYLSISSDLNIISVSYYILNTITILLR